MNICIESHVLNHHRRGGLMTYTEGLVNGLYQNDQANDYVLTYYSLKRGPQDMPGPIGPHFHKTVLKIPDREFRGRQFLIDKIALPIFFRSNKISIFHRPSGYTMPAVKGVLNVLTVHDLRTLTIADPVWPQNITNYKKTLNSLDVCVVVSECTKKDLLKYLKIDERKIKVIYLGADKRFKPAAHSKIEAVRAKYGIDQPFLLSVGSLPRKNIDGIISGFAGSKIKNEFLLVLSCSCDISKYRRLAHDLGIDKRLFILDKVTDEEVVALYRGCHCLLFP